MSAFWINQFVKFFILIVISYINGLLVRHYGVKVNYTRKINHFSLFFIPMYIETIAPYEKSLGLFILGSVFGVFTLIIYIKPLRERLTIIATMFLSFDRPEDRPYTLRWLSTQIIASFLVVIPMIILFAQNNIMDLLLVPILINGIGDGLAEPVGIRFGKNKYTTSGLFIKKKYVRSLEGSACVFITSIIVVALYYAHFSQIQFIVALALIPIIMTAAEALSPHTWDSPFLYLLVYLSLYAITSI